MSGDLPWQSQSEAELETLNAIGEILSDSLNITIGLPFILQLLVKGIMSRLWLWINMMQLYTALTILPVKTPLNVLIIQSYFNGIINMEVLPKDVVNDVVNFLLFWREPDQTQETDVEARRLEEEESK